jgi:hypothetical protein
VTARRRLLVVAIILASVGLPYALGGAIALIFGQPFKDSVRAATVLVVGMAMLVTFVIRIGGVLARGHVLFNSGSRPKHKLLRAFAVFALLASLVNLEAARRTAELAPVDARLRQDLGAQYQILVQTKQHLVEQTRSIERSAQHITSFNLNKQDQATIAKFSGLVRQDRAGLARLKELTRHDTAEQKKISDQVLRDRAEQAHLNNRLLPDQDAVEQGLEDLGRGAVTLATQPWEVLKSQAFFQFFLSVLCLNSALMMSLVSSGQNQIRENGIWQNGRLLPWAKFDSYRWQDDSTVEFIGANTPASATFPVAPGQKQAVTEFLDQRLYAVK